MSGRARGFGILPHLLCGLALLAMAGPALAQDEGGDAGSGSGFDSGSGVGGGGDFLGQDGGGGAFEALPVGDGSQPVAVSGGDAGASGGSWLSTMGSVAGDAFGTLASPWVDTGKALWGAASESPFGQRVSAGVGLATDIWGGIQDPGRDSFLTQFNDLPIGTRSELDVDRVTALFPGLERNDLRVYVTPNGTEGVWDGTTRIGLSSNYTGTLVDALGRLATDRGVQGADRIQQASDFLGRAIPGQRVSVWLDADSGFRPGEGGTPTFSQAPGIDAAMVIVGNPTQVGTLERGQVSAVFSQDAAGRLINTALRDRGVIGTKGQDLPDHGRIDLSMSTRIGEVRTDGNYGGVTLPVGVNVQGVGPRGNRHGMQAGLTAGGRVAGVDPEKGDVTIEIFGRGGWNSYTTAGIFPNGPIPNLIRGAIDRQVPGQFGRAISDAEREIGRNSGPVVWSSPLDLTGSAGGGGIRVDGRGTINLRDTMDRMGLPSGATLTGVRVLPDGTLRVDTAVDLLEFWKSSRAQ